MNVDTRLRLILYAPHEFGGRAAKTAEGLLRYRPEAAACVVDPVKAGLTAAAVIGAGGAVPVVRTIEEAIALGADAVLLGCAFAGGRMPQSWRDDILKAIKSGLSIINGLHDFLVDDAEFSSAAGSMDVSLIDLRMPPEKLNIATGRAASLKAHTVLTVGSDCSVGKMTTSLELLGAARKANRPSRFVATGQTGIIIDGCGVAIDRVIGDFMAGVVEDLVIEAAAGSEYVFIEGQGSIIHPGYSGVTLSILHGAAAECLILCHQEGRITTGESDHVIPELPVLVEIYESLARFIRPTKVVGVAIDSRSIASDADARARLEEYSRQTGLPVTDPVRFGAANLFQAIESYCQ
ncbi:MAG: DUF1611 domain-containing protein [Candidatus Melainabacteria bacterium]|nr:DUF1611 domain-containing protein [Candidatus Melainabacteria bacterium]